MAYTVPTAAEVKARFPAFAAVGDPVVDSAIAEAQRQVDATWTEGDYTLGIMLYAAHVLASEGQGTDVATQLAGFKRVKIGPLDLERDTSQAAQAGGLESTSYGVRFAALQLQNIGAGPIII
jgi:hypothetical protein